MQTHLGSKPVYLIRNVLLFLLATLFGGAVEAGTNGFILPQFRGAANSRVGFWETFTAPVGTPGNRADQPGATTDVVITQSDTNAFLTGSGNIYNLETSAFSITDSSSSALGTVVLQIRTIGTELDYKSISLTYSNASGVAAPASSGKP